MSNTVSILDDHRSASIRLCAISFPVQTVIVRIDPRFSIKLKWVRRNRAADRLPSEKDMMLVEF